MQSWYSDFNSPGFPGYFTQLLWAETDQLGCGKVVFNQDVGYKIKIICNYAVAADLKDPGSMYKSGEACSTCPDTCDDGLCSKGGQTQDCQYFQGQIPIGNDISKDIVDPNDACSALCSLDPNCQDMEFVILSLRLKK